MTIPRDDANTGERLVLQFFIHKGWKVPQFEKVSAKSQPIIRHSIVIDFQMI